MAKTEVVEPQKGEKPAQITLDEFCTRISLSDKRVELIGAFHHCEKLEKRIKDDESAFQIRFNAFVNKPV